MEWKHARPWVYGMGGMVLLIAVIVLIELMSA